MDNLDIPQTGASPSIRTDWAAGTIVMRGDSYPENSFELFQPLIDWVTAYLTQAGRPLRLELELLYLNTSSIRALMDILDLLEQAHGRGGRVSVRWSYNPDNERVAELAAEFKEDCSFPFEIIGKAEP